MVSNHFLIEANHRVIGLAVRVRGGFRFTAADDRFRALEGKVFRRVKVIDRLAAVLGATLSPPVAGVLR